MDKHILITKETHLYNVLWKGHLHEDVLLEPGDILDANDSNQMQPDLVPDGVPYDEDLYWQSDSDISEGDGGFDLYDDDNDFDADDSDIVLTEPTDIEGDTFEPGSSFDVVYPGMDDETPYCDPDNDGDNDCYEPEDTDDDMDMMQDDMDTYPVDLQPYGNGDGENDFTENIPMMYEDEDFVNDNTGEAHDVEGNPVSPDSDNPYIYNGEAPKQGDFVDMHKVVVPEKVTFRVPGYKVILEKGDTIIVYTRKKTKYIGK